jgi:hypothetical protein
MFSSSEFFVCVSGAWHQDLTAQVTVLLTKWFWLFCESKFFFNTLVSILFLLTFNYCFLVAFLLFGFESGLFATLLSPFLFFFLFIRFLVYSLRSLY